MVGAGRSDERLLRWIDGCEDGWKICVRVRGRGEVTYKLIVWERYDDLHQTATERSLDYCSCGDVIFFSSKPDVIRGFE